jgi:hypothetical protein
LRERALPPNLLRFRLSSPPRNKTGRTVRVDEDASGRASRLDRSEATRRHAVLEQPLSFAEHQRKDPDATLVDSDGARRLY